MSALDMQDVRKVYESGNDKIVALDGVDLSVGDTEMVTLLGPSGSGKTTLLSIAGALLSPTSGTVIVGGTDVTHLGERARTRFRQEQVGFVFQSVNLVPFLTARENLLVVAELAGRNRSTACRRADLLLGELGLTGRSSNLATQLSGGERQRVAIGRALMNEPRLVLVDEPTSALDTRMGEQVMSLLRQEITGRGVAAIIVTHDNRMTRYTDRVVGITDGRISTMATT